MSGRGAVTGMLKTGKKGLYVFDRNGQHYQVSPPCVLDFYVHESRQRTGLGKRLFEHMLQTENIEPVKMAIDRPSDKFLGFLNKHYTLSNPVKQMNNYVVFDGFFPSSPEKNGTVEHSHSGDTPGKKQSANGLQTTSYTSPLGRYGAPRPPCSMGQIIHNQTSTIPKNTEPTGVNSVRSAPETNFQSIPGNSPGYPTTVTQSTPNIYYRSPEQQNPNMVQTRQNYQQSQPQITNNPNELYQNSSVNEITFFNSDMRTAEDDDLMFKYGYPPQVPDADTQVMEEKVSSSPKLERPRSLSIQLSEEQTEDKKIDDVESEVPAKETDIEEEVIEKLTVSENGAVIEQKDEISTPDKQTPGKRTPSHLTEQGFFDLKFYHNKLW
ncbi:mediator of RNA polymerase II transcription subunit 26 [Asbolus verrucosus]|uniref:Mediator of RNA polymerase II transcription subunit 26 n=1 Tax=Asbolus verrucosus TaxID=1661398 RepID=A0A482W8T0_ASBVE|nr:mediator of RNA polymerase II transcription subunit 26 [Asbolus verrucosus]